LFRLKKNKSSTSKISCTFGNVGRSAMAKVENQTSAQQYTSRQSGHRAVERQASAWDAQVAATPQRTLGNQALARRSNAAGTLHTQAKLTVGPAVDQYEREADSVASQVVQGIQARQTASGGAQGQAGNVQRQGGEEDELQMKRVSISTLQRESEEDELETQEKSVDGTVRLQRESEEDELETQEKSVDGTVRLQRESEEDELETQEKSVDGTVRLQRESEEDELEAQGKRDPASGALGGDVTNEVESSIRAQRGGGNAMPEATRSAMESGFGADFSGVRIHQGASADSLNRSLSAKAFTSGSDIFFRSGEYDPGSQQGQQLLAHELTHVVQQGAASQNRQ